ncbi:hypothetical protein VF21_04509 [Pseudogymnoascus sp. 05NY08]|nr:hypothetical protein VF21_04509 [Pseudogymnoascus sp. 05NY08]
MARLFIAQIFLALAVIVSTSSLSPRQSCGTAYYCSSTSGGSSGSGGASAAEWIADAAAITGFINAGSYIKRSLHSRQEDGALCCISGTECGLLGDDNIPICYDPQTTKFTFADGSYGYTSTGNYYDTEGNVFNFETGDYTLADGTLGNVFVDNGEVPPATATNTRVINSVSIPSATNTGVIDSVSIPSATDTVKINEGPIATGTE